MLNVSKGKIQNIANKIIKLDQKNCSKGTYSLVILEIIGNTLIDIQLSFWRPISGKVILAWTSMIVKIWGKNDRYLGCGISQYLRGINVAV